MRPLSLDSTPQTADVRLIHSISRRSSTSTSINGIYLVSIATVVVSPDVSLHTASGSIDTTLYFNGGLNRPIGIRASSASGSINLSLPEQKHAQLLGVEIRNESGQCRGCDDS